jgi:hypothetical protein
LYIKEFFVGIFSISKIISSFIDILVFKYKDNHSYSDPLTLHPYIQADRQGPGSAGALYKNSLNIKELTKN